MKSISASCSPRPHRYQENPYLPAASPSSFVPLPLASSLSALVLLKSYFFPFPSVSYTSGRSLCRCFLWLLFPPFQPSVISCCSPWHADKDACFLFLMLLSLWCLSVQATVKNVALACRRCACTVRFNASPMAMSAKLHGRKANVTQCEGM